MRFSIAIPVIHSVALSADFRAPVWLPDDLQTDFNTHYLHYLTEPYERIREFTTKGDIIVSHDEYNSAWPGAQLIREFSFFDLQTSISKFIPENDGCVDILDFWIFRPSWFVPRRRDILAARSCIEVLLEWVPAVIETNLENEGMKSAAVKLYRILREIIPLAYSEEAFWIIETENSQESNSLAKQQIATRSSNEPESTLRGIIELIPALAQAIRQSDVFLEDFVLEFDPSTPDRRFLDRILASDEMSGYLIVQLPAFLDHHRSNLNAWRFVVKNIEEFGLLDAWATTSRYAVVLNPHFFSSRKIHSFFGRGLISPAEGWARTVRVVHSLDKAHGTNVLSKCLPLAKSEGFDSRLSRDTGVPVEKLVERFANTNELSDIVVFFEPLKNAKIGNAALYDLCDCVVEAAIDGELKIDPTDEAAVTALLWQIRIVTSTVASLDLEFRTPEEIASVFNFSGADADI